MITDAEQFIRIYIDKDYDLGRTAIACGSTTTLVKARVKRYRKKGINLPIKHPTANKLRVAELNKLIKELKNAQ